MQKIASFTVNHDYIVPGIYISRIDGDITTFDLRTRKPNCNDYMDNLTMHSVEHMVATLIRNSEIKDNVIYFGPMGCQTGFYLLTRSVPKTTVLKVLIEILEQIVEKEEKMYGDSRIECGKYKNLNLQAAKEECKKFLKVLKESENTFKYSEG